MKKYRLLVFCVIFQISSPIWASGDLGGGGTLKKMRADFKLSPHDVSEFQKVPTDAETYQVWLNEMNDNYREELLKKVFKHHIKPQIKR